MATHDVRRGLELADQVLVLDDGRVALQRSGRLDPADVAGACRDRSGAGALV